MKLTKKARSVLLAACERDWIGASRVADILGYGRMYLRAGQYVGRLKREGWINSRIQWYRGVRGYEIYSHMEYFITAKGREELRLSNSVANASAVSVSNSKSEVEQQHEEDG